jgi:hypothetical protein
MLNFWNRATFQMGTAIPQSWKIRPLVHTRPSPSARLQLFDQLSSDLEGDTAQSLELCYVLHSFVDFDYQKAIDWAKAKINIV